jgi:hypothetical protein
VTNDGLSPPSQLRRLAEFATVLGDYKLAIMVWEALRKENKGGSVSFQMNHEIYTHMSLRTSFPYC